MEPAAAAGAAPSRRDRRRPRRRGRTSGPRKRRSRPTPAGRRRTPTRRCAASSTSRSRGCKKYRDYREMLEKQKDIDAVIVATPDHMHAAIASAAMSLGKHVYVQKPLCWSVHEARHLAKKAKRQSEGRDADGQPASLGRQLAAGHRIHPGRRARRDPRGARLDEPAARLLASGDPPAGAALDRSRRSCAGTIAA